jgi:hypothetical protein
MSGVEPRDRFTFNAYDLFSNFLPGVVLLFGLWFPFARLAEPLPDLTLVQATAGAIIAFGAGVGTQSIGSMTSKRKVFGAWPWSERTRPFNEKMNEMLEADDCPPDCASIDWAARQLCADAFGLDCDGSDDCAYVFKSLIAYLEGSSWNRAIRIQALHLSSRALYIVCLLLFVYYGAFALGLSASADLTPIAYDGIFDPESLGAIGLGMVPLSWVFFVRARHFESDVAKYILVEFYISHYDWNGLDANGVGVSPDELTDERRATAGSDAADGDPAVDEKPHQSGD